VISIQLTPMAGGSMLRIEGMGGWAAFELTREQTLTIRDAADHALSKSLCPTLAALLDRSTGR
jgi:hypothetical protein